MKSLWAIQTIKAKCLKVCKWNIMKQFAFVKSMFFSNKENYSSDG